MFSGAIERNQWHEMGQWSKLTSKSTLQKNCNDNKNKIKSLLQLSLTKLLNLLKQWQCS